MKYRPYKGYGRIPHYLYPCPCRIRTRSDWRWNYRPFPLAEKSLWKRWGNCYSQHAGFEKRYAHHRFRLAARQAIAAELAGDDAISQAFWVSGNWLD